MNAKTVLISGAGIGIGRATAFAFARAGYVVFVTDILDEEGRQVVREIEGEDGKARFKHLDVTDTAACDAIVAEIDAEFGGVDVVVANAGIAHKVPLAQLTDEKWDFTLDVDLKGVFRLARAAAPKMRERRRGAIVAVSSISGSTYGWDDHIQYSAAKAGIIGLVRALATELGPHGIRANAVAPGLIRTAQALSVEHSLGPDRLEAAGASIPLGRVGEPDDIADVILFLASDGARYLTGQVIIVDGGLVVKQY